MDPLLIPAAAKTRDSVEPTSQLMRLVAHLPQPNPRKHGNKLWNAVARLSH